MSCRLKARSQNGHKNAGERSGGFNGMPSAAKLSAWELLTLWRSRCSIRSKPLLQGAQRKRLDDSLLTELCSTVIDGARGSRTGPGFMDGVYVVGPGPKEVGPGPMILSYVVDSGPDVMSST